MIFGILSSDIRGYSASPPNKRLVSFAALARTHRPAAAAPAQPLR